MYLEDFLGQEGDSLGLRVKYLILQPKRIFCFSLHVRDIAVIRHHNVGVFRAATFLF